MRGELVGLSKYRTKGERGWWTVEAVGTGIYFGETGYPSYICYKQSRARCDVSQAHNA